MTRHGSTKRWILLRAVATMTGLVVGSSVTLVAQEAMSPPESGFRAEILTDLARLEQKLVGLAEAIPEDDFAWRPVETVRTTGEIFVHVAESNHRILQAIGAETLDPPDSLEGVVVKEEILGALRGSIDAMRQAILGTANADLESQVQFLGRDWSQRALFYLSATHMHEHLGQVVAYARSVGVVPPWSQHLGDETQS